MFSMMMRKKWKLLNKYENHCFHPRSLYSLTLKFPPIIDNEIRNLTMKPYFIYKIAIISLLMISKEAQAPYHILHGGSQFSLL